MVACNSKDKGADVRKVCQVGCIGCKICQVKFPEAGFKVEDNLAVASPEAPEDQAALAMEACPRKIITRR